MNGRSTEPLHISQCAIALPPQPHFKVEFHKPINSHGHLKYSILHSIVMFLDLCTHIMTSESVTRIVGLHRPINLHVHQIALCGQDCDIVKMNIGEWIITRSCDQEISYTYTWRKVASGRPWPWDPKRHTPCNSQIGRWHVLVDMMHKQESPPITWHE